MRAHRVTSVLGRGTRGRVRICLRGTGGARQRAARSMEWFDRVVDGRGVIFTVSSHRVSASTSSARREAALLRSVASLSRLALGLREGRRWCRGPRGHRVVGGAGVGRRRWRGPAELAAEPGVQALQVGEVRGAGPACRHRRCAQRRDDRRQPAPGRRPSRGSAGCRLGPLPARAGCMAPANRHTGGWRRGTPVATGALDTSGDSGVTTGV